MNNESNTRKRLPRLGCFGWGFVAMVTMLLAFTAAVTIWWNGVSRDVHDRLARLRTAGEPVTADDLADLYRLPPDVSDDSRFWLTAIEPLDGEAFAAACEKAPLDNMLEGDIPAPGEPWPQLDDVRQLLAMYAASIRGLHEAAACQGGARYPMNFNEGIAMQLPHAQRLRGAAKLLALEALVKAHEGDATGAADAIHAGFAVGRTLDHDPILISLLVRIACDSMARQQLEHLVSRVTFSDADLAGFRADLQQARYQAGLSRAMRGERVTGLATIKNPAMAMGNDAPVWGGLFVLRGNDTRRYLDCMELVVAKAQLPPPQALAGMKQLDSDLHARMGVGSVAGRFRNPLTIQLMPAMTKVFIAAARGAASNDAADAALAVEQFHRRHSKLPEHLIDLVPEFLPALPADAFGGQPLRYVVRADGYVVYSVGQDLIDQGGTKGPTPNDPRDLTFEIKRNEIVLP